MSRENVSVAYPWNLDSATFGHEGLNAICEEGFYQQTIHSRNVRQQESEKLRISCNDYHFHFRIELFSCFKQEVAVQVQHK